MIRLGRELDLEAIAAILQGLASSSQLIAADIGAGTGIASRLLEERDVKVLAIAG